MQKLALLAAAALLALAAGCNPADTVSEAHAEALGVSAVALWPAPAADAQDGEVYEYH
ncbi:MAG TPA: hypothetical protein VGP97_14365 [Burkholderiales bacterium]|jgi:hypothetical protein|nr:hypothetical protein [Burkholderiales bacterium]